MRRLVTILAVSVVLAGFARAETNALNLVLVFDASGSMAATLGNETRIEAARRTLQYVVDSLPAGEAGLNVGLRVFGHKGDNTAAGKAASCQSTELVVPVASVDKGSLYRQTVAYRPTGWTPITLALTEAAQDLAKAPAGRNVVVLVTDGEESCGGDPCAAARALSASGAGVVTHVVGFGPEAMASSGLRCIAEAGGGLYLDAAGAEALSGVLLGVVGEELRASGRSLELSGEAASVEVVRVTLPNISVDGRSGSVHVGDGAGGVTVDGGSGSVHVGDGAGGVTVDGGTGEIRIGAGSEGIAVDAGSGTVTIGGQKGGVTIGGGKVVIGGAGGRTFDMPAVVCGSGQKCSCSAGRVCLFDCPSGNCDVKCSSGAVCTVNCPGGNCDVSCGSGATCTVNCDGGNCDVKCGSGAVCATNCPGGNCDVDCSRTATCT
jgi:Ca-activated chloride channel homolog